MAKKKTKTSPVEPPSAQELRRKRLLSQLTPAGKLFARKLRKSLVDELTLLSCVAADQIKEHIEEHHLQTSESVESINNLAQSHASARVTSYYMIMNHAALLLSSGKMHRSQGVLTDRGEQLFEIWLIYANRLEDLGIIPAEQIELERQRIREAIGKIGKPAPFSLTGAVKSLFKRGDKGQGNG